MCIRDRYYKCYEIDYDRHRYDGKNGTYVNLPVEDIKEMAIASLKDRDVYKRQPIH